MIPHVRVRLLLAGRVSADKVMRDGGILHVGPFLMGTSRVWEPRGRRRTVVRVSVLGFRPASRRLSFHPAPLRRVAQNAARCVVELQASSQVE